ncbi:voltage-gated ion channel superfamily, putative [Bodo saltans]|uniref:Voltage-gated ion channel superfamily, putative n=1 Tax=Bodo saltans TaxID=75058 RepID=A0A0S4KKL8_BODSA|nr:voltage-gated ion channel superfamily, putative [Bodo saltans]|eukprot:CUI15139.1 voltage-gated ion channel superfamily, putative [Bodo saltans]
MYSTECAGLPRSNFDSFGTAMLTSFIIATGDNWNYIMYNGMNSVNVAVAIPFVVYFYVSVYILMNLLVSILLSAADREHTATEEELLEQQRQDNEAEKKGLLQKAANSGGGEEDPFAVQTYTEEDVERMLQENSDEDKEEEEDEEEDDDDYDEGMDVIVSRSGKVKEKSRSAKVVEELSRMWDRSRKSLKKVVEHKAWQTAMVLNILVGTCSMGFEDPIAAPDSKSVQVTRDIDLVTTIIFLIELALYVHVFGLVRKPSAYLRRDGWNVVDFCLIIISFTTMLIVRAGVLDSTSRTMLFVFFLRSLRPLRVIRQARGMRKVMSAVLGSLPEMKWVFVVTLGIFATWGVFGVFFFAGALRSCWLDGTMLAEADEALCATLGGDFINSELHFDNILFAMLTIFVCSTLENWSIIMFRAMDIVAVGQPFRRNANVWASLYFIVAAAFCGLIVMNLFVSVLISSYNERKRKAAFQRSILLTKEQEAWITTNKRLARLLPIRNQKGMAADQQVAVTKEGILVFHSQVSTLTPQTVLRKQEGEQITAKVHHHVGRLRVKLREITRSSTFSNLFLAIVLANFVVSAIVTYPQSDSLTNTINSISQAFTICFVLEAALKIGGDTFAVYVSSTWNRLDFLVAMVSLIALILASFYDAKPFSLIETLRITRLARLTKEYFSLDRMISKFGAAILAIGHVMGVILMVYFIYAVLGMRMFGRVWQQAFGGSNNGGASDGIDTNQNFASLQHAMILLMRMTTQGDWPVLMMTSSFAFSLSSPNFCDLNIGNCGLAVPAAEVYYVTFIFLATVVLTNLFTAVLLDAFGSSGLTRALRKKEAEIFFKNWKEYDPDDTMTINPYDILPFIRSIPKECVLGFNGRPKRKRIGLEVNLLTSLQLVDLTHRVTWVALVDALCRAAYPIPFKPRNSIVYLVYTDLLHLPLQQFAQIGRNMLEITGAAQSFGKTAFMNVQRLSRLVSGKKIKRRNRARKSRSASGKRNSKKKGGKFDEADVNNIHQDVMMFLSTMPPDCMFNPFLLPSIFLSALKTIALHARDEMMKHFLHMNKNLIEDLDENGNLISTEPENLKGSKLNASALGSPSRRIDELGSPASPSAFSPREGGIGFNSSVSEADGGVTNTSIVDGSSIANGDIDDDPVLHLADLFPATHPVMAMLQPSDLRDLFSKCAALIMINAVIKKRRSRLAQRVLETKIERDILAKLRRELGIVVPESVLRSSNYREHDDVRSPLSITTQDNSNANASNSNTAPGSPDVRRARSVTQIQMGGQALMSSGMGGGGAGMASEIALDSRFSIATKPEEKPRDRRPTVMVKDSEEGGGDDPASPTGAEAASPPTAASPTESGSSSRKSKAPYDEFEIPYKPSTLRLPPRATEIVPDHSALEPLKWILIDDSHQHLFSTTHQRPGGSAFSPHASADDGAGLPSLLAPYDVCGMFAEIVLGDPILSANLLEEVQLTRATMTTCLTQLSDWRVASDQLHEIIKPMLLQGLQPMVFSEDLSDSVELLAFRALGAATTSTQAIKKASGITHIVPSLPIKLKDLIDASTIPALGRTPQLYRDVLKRQVQAGKERQNDHITQLMMSYKKLAATAEQLEKKVVDVWPQEGRKKMEEGVIALVNQCSQDFKRIEIDGVNSVFAGAKLPKTMYQTVGNVTTQVTTAPVNPTALAYRWVSLYRTLEMVQYISTQWDNVKTVKMLANPRATLTAASLKAVQYYYSVTDLSELSARANSNAAKAQARSMSVPQAIDKLVVNSLFRSPSPSNLDSLSAVLQDVLVQEVRKIIDGTGQLVKKPSAANPSSPLKDEKRRRSSTIKATSSNLSIAKTLENLAAAAASEEVAVDPLANETDEKRCLRILRDEMKTRINYAPQEREDPYLTSVVNFCSTLSKSEKMKAESKLTQAPRTNSAFAAADGKSNELIQRIPELLTLEEFEQQLIQDLEAMTSEIVSSIKFFVATPRKFVTAGAGFMKSLVKWKSGEVSDFSAISVRTLIVASERDKLNLSVDSVQKQRKLLGIAETEVDVLGHISNSHRASLSSITAFTPAVDVPTDILQKLETKMQENPEEVLLLRSEEGVTVHALTKTVVSPFATQPDARSVQHMLDVIMTLHAWANVVSTRRNRDPLNIMNESQETFEVLGKMTNTIAVVAKDSLKALAIHGHSHAASVSTTVQRLYRTQPGLDAALEGYARASAKCAVALNDLQRTFARLLCAATELIVSHENEKQQQIFRPQRKLTRIAQVNEAENHSSAPPPMIQDGDEVVDSNPRGSSTQSSGNGDPLDIIGDARKPSSGDNNNRESASVSSPLWKRDSVKEQSSSSLRRGGGRSHEQLIADAKARMEARKLGVTPSFRDISASPEPRASSSSRRVNPAANVTGSPRSSVASPLTRENVSGATASSPLLLTTTVQSQRADVTALEATAQQLASLCRNPKPKPNEVLTVLVALVEHKVSIKYFQLRANNSSPATEKKYDKLPRNELLFIPALLKLSLPFSVSDRASVPKNASDCFVHATLSITKKANRDEIRGAVAISNISQVRYPLSLTKDLDCGFDSASSSQPEWANVLPRVVAVDDIHHRTIHFFLMPQESAARQLFQILDAIRDSVAL